jgi:hypothetical protein
MIKPIPPFQWETEGARQWVAQQLGLPYNEGMQDWPWEVSSPEGLTDYFHLYTQAADEERVVIMEMLLNAANQQITLQKQYLAWVKIAVLLDQNADLHASTAHYWCCWDYNEQDLYESGFSITPYVRAWWVANYPVPDDLTHF